MVIILFCIPVITLCLMGILSVRASIIQNYLFRIYLCKHHHQAWEVLTGGSFCFPGGYNYFRGPLFLYGDDDLGDPEVARLKSKTRRAFHYVLAAFILNIVVFSACVYLALLWALRGT